MDNQEQSKIEQLKKGLYSRTGRFVEKEPHLHKKKYDVKSEWGDQSVEQIVSQKDQKRKKFLSKVLIVSVVFFVISLGVALFSILGGFSSVSTSNIDISVIGPASIESGGELSLQIMVTNNNATDLELADLNIDFPKGTRSFDTSQELDSTHESLNTIKAGASVRKEIKAIMYGEEGSTNEIDIGLQYRIAGSNAIFFKDRKYEVNISSSPVNLVVSPIEEVISGQEVELSVNLMSNSENPINDLLLVADYPFGFEFESADPKPTYDNNVWKISNIDPKEGKTIKIKGIITGQSEEERVFNFSAGTSSDQNDRDVEAVFATVSKSIFIKKPFMGLDLAINGKNTQEYVTNGDGDIRVDVTWVNGSPDRILDAEIKIKLSGDVFDKSKVSVDKGFFNSSNNTIVWNSNTNGELSEILPGDSGRFSFSLRPVDISKRGFLTNPEISIVADVQGNRVGEEKITEKITSSIERKIKISSDLSIVPLSTYYTGPFVNSGPMPPKAEQETTYTVTWTITNTSNDLSDVVARSTLPPYVTWKGVVSPRTENISYNPIGGTLVWNVGDVKSGVGIKTEPKTISFQVSLLPSLTQVGLSPNLTNSVSVTATDRFTGATLSDSRDGVSTRLTSEAGFGDDKWVVVK